VYGVFHTALRDMISSKFDRTQWQCIASRAGLAEHHLLRAKDYDDTLSFRLFETAAEELDIPLERLKEKLGAFFIMESAASIRDTLTMGTRPGFERAILGFSSWISTLNKSMPNFSLGRFPAARLGEGRYRMEYVSTRPGMVAFVRGMLFGVANLYDKSIRIETDNKATPATEYGAVFLISVEGVNENA